jgi:hypothetical protein
MQFHLIIAFLKCFGIFNKNPLHFLVRIMSSDSDDILTRLKMETMMTIVTNSGKKRTASIALYRGLGKSNSVVNRQ